VTFHTTFTSAVSPEQGERVLRATFRDLAAKVIHGHVEVAWCYERHRSGYLHVHGLAKVLDGSGVLERNSVIGFWRGADTKLAGTAVVRPYEPGGSDERYVTKWGGEVDRQVACPRTLACKRRGCRVTTIPWG